MKVGRSFAKVPDGQTVVGIVEHQGHVIVATTGGVYRLYGDTLLPLRFVPVPDEPYAATKQTSPAPAATGQDGAK